MESHLAQLQAIGLPQNLHQPLLDKLSKCIIDAGSYFQFGEIDGDTRTPYALYATKDLKKNSNVFLIDHAWTTTIEKAFSSLVDNDKLREMCCEVMKISAFEDSQQEECTVENVGTEENEVVNPINVESEPCFPYGQYLNLSGNGLRNFPSDVQELSNTQQITALNLTLNNFSDSTLLFQEIPEQVQKSLKALYLSDNLFTNNKQLQDHAQHHFSQLEIFNSKLTEAYTTWSILFLCDVTSPDQVYCVDVSGREVPTWKQSVWSQFTNCHTIDVTNTSIDDIQSFISCISSMNRLKKLKIDYRYQKYIHEAVALGRLPKLVYVNGWPSHLSTPTTTELTATAICDKMFNYLETYRLSNQHTSLGLSIRHNQHGNVKLAPFFYYNTQETFTLLWPVDDLNQGDEVTRDYLHGTKDQQRRDLLQMIYDRSSMDQEELERVARQQQPDSHIKQNISLSNEPIKAIRSKNNYKVYTDSKLVIERITEYSSFQHVDDPLFTFTDDPKQADILWYTHEHFRDYENIYQTHQMVNQFKNEHLFTIKPEFAKSVRDMKLPFLIQTYDMSNNSDVARFLLDYDQREKSSQVNLWIVKPANLSRSMNMNVVNSDTAVLKLTEMGPVVVSHYIHNPLTLTGRKFDLRLHVMARVRCDSDDQPKLLTYMTDDIVVRISNKQYSVDNLHDFEKHFTVMNYRHEENPDQVGQDYLCSTRVYRCFR
ncbi:tubulin-tyrosine ligase-like protein [Acrasis kona]|uniref:Tubulin-tyrosine ligase-like protein n=1 Tax=Acrasis kona TaxID=1008807 RepID=A0AAW2YJB1_9EUKA